MKLIKKALAVIGLVVIILAIKFSYSYIDIFAQTVDQKPVKAGVLLYRFDDAYISLVRQGFEEIQKNNPDKVQFTFYDAKDDQMIQNQTIEAILENKSEDILLLNIVDVKRAYEVIGRIKEFNIPVVLFNREPLDMNSVKSYNKAFFVGTDSAQAGAFQGEIIINAWNKNKDTMDANNDGILQYVMLIGENNNKDANERTEYSILTINNGGIQTQEIASTVSDWNREQAKTDFEPIFIRYNTGIEAIISNNDEMAIGAIEVLNKYGYNTEDGTKNIAVVGVDAIPAAQELIKKGEMTGSVVQDANVVAEASYVIGINLFNDQNPLEGTSYKFDDTGVAIRLPYKEYVG
ncbi:galactose ABC transporter substrate-binding protein [Clostridium saccharoperbutylacetonicum]|uniref:galactose ABC transporter substrate-binding protein n=1 Tax=Clostridium saccharoperbutylacetonicum TaxID=36745 RepID=UPI00098396AC|nr:galactose ABC transporter substrate-binding protein [Clostridium saccharoperbutylacetonicum]AQR96266.1 D-galactose-binding periplasmic protein precursor [Clostridium saccharoperbutylacetonicum]NSB32139.1 methyl-galactoside transport system substrate-binding protein [Clostridium saccharoperbutylacetonicum]